MPTRGGQLQHDGEHVVRRRLALEPGDGLLQHCRQELCRGGGQAAGQGGQAVDTGQESDRLRILRRGHDETHAGRVETECDRDGAPVTRQRDRGGDRGGGRDLRIGVHIECHVDVERRDIGSAESSAEPDPRRGRPRRRQQVSAGQPEPARRVQSDGASEGLEQVVDLRAVQGAVRPERIAAAKPAGRDRAAARPPGRFRRRSCRRAGR